MKDRLRSLFWAVVIFLTSPIWFILLVIFIIVMAITFKDVDWDEYDAELYYS